MATQEFETPKENAAAARRGEGMMVLMQNNDEKSVIINGMNETLEQLLGYAKGEITGRKVETVLGKREAELIADDLEYADSAPDFGDIFSRIREVKLRRRLGDEIRVECTLSRLMAEGRNARFQFVIPNEVDRIASDKFRDFIQLNLEGRKQLDVATGLPNRDTAVSFLPLLKNYFAEAPVSIVFATIQLDRFDKSVKRYGAETCSQLMKHAHNCCRATFRSHDVIFALSDRMLGVVLFDISRESARVVFNRLRWKIRNHRFDFGGKPDFSISVSIGFDLLDLERAESVMEACETSLTSLDANERNSLVELADG